MACRCDRSALATKLLYRDLSSELRLKGSLPKATQGVRVAKRPGIPKTFSNCDIRARRESLQHRRVPHPETLHRASTRRNESPRICLCCRRGRVNGTYLPMATMDDFCPIRLQRRTQTWKTCRRRVKRVIRGRDT